MKIAASETERLMLFLDDLSIFFIRRRQLAVKMASQIRLGEIFRCWPGIQELCSIELHLARREGAKRLVGLGRKGRLARRAVEK